MGMDTDPTTFVIPLKQHVVCKRANSHYSLAHCYDVIAGGVTIMMAALGQHKEAAVGVRMFLSHYLNTPAMSLEQLDNVKALMCCMQGVLRFLSMLCPTFSMEEEAMLAPGESPMLLYKHVMHVSTRVLACFAFDHKRTIPDCMVYMIEALCLPPIIRVDLCIAIAKLLYLLSCILLADRRSAHVNVYWDCQRGAGNSTRDATCGIMLAAVAAYGHNWVYSLESCNISKVGQANTLSSTAHIMNELLEQEGPWKGKSELPPRGHSSNRNASQPVNHTAKVLPTWPTPTADAWAKKTEIALRVFTTLHW